MKEISREVSFLFLLWCISIVIKGAGISYLEGSVTNIEKMKSDAKKNSKF